MVRTDVSISPECKLNRHFLIYGGSGTGKTRGFVKPFILSAISRLESVLAVDVKSELFEATSAYAREKGYEVRAFNLLDMMNSDGINCLADIHDDVTLIQTIADVIIKNTSNTNERQDFWEKAETNLLVALLHYVQRRTDARGELLPVEQRTLGAIYRILSELSFDEIDGIFAQLPKGHPALPPYGIFRLANRQILGNIAIGLGNRLAVFQNQLVDKITSYNDIDLILPGVKPCIYYCIISASDSSLEFLSSLFFSLSFNKLMNHARRNYPNACLPVPVNVLLEEACNIGYLADFKRTISVCRSFNIHCQVITQGIAQFADRYPQHEWEEIIGNCDTQIFLGCNDHMTAKYISEKCGVATIRTTTMQRPLHVTLTATPSAYRYSEGQANAQRPMMYPDELLRMDNAKEIVLFRGQSPLMLYKITPEELPVYQELRPMRATDYIPAWRTAEATKVNQTAEDPCQPVSEPISFSTQLFDQTNLFEEGEEQSAAAQCQTADAKPEQIVEHSRKKRPDESSERQEQPCSSHLKYTHITPYEVLDDVRQQEELQEKHSHESKKG